MCGLVGVAGNIGVTEEKMFVDLLRLDTFRGPHSTGVCKVPKHNNKIFLLKDVGTPWDLEYHQEYKNLLSGFSRVFMGHNRWATKGDISTKNAHPFVAGHIIGAHNGTLRRQDLLTDHKSFEVDSENIMHEISLHGIEATTPKLCGAYALTFYNTETEELSFVRNNERTLFYCYSEDGRTLFWASESTMLMYIFNKYNRKHTDIIPFTADQWYRVAIPTNTNGINKFTMKPVKTYTYPVYVNTNHNNRYKQDPELYDDADGYWVQGVFYPYQYGTGNVVNMRGNVINRQGVDIITPQKHLPLVDMTKPIAASNIVSKLGKVVEFNVLRTMVGSGKNDSYIEGNTIEGEKVRAFIPHNSERWSKFAKVGEVLQGYVASKTYNADSKYHYYRIKISTVDFAKLKPVVVSNHTEEETKEKKSDCGKRQMFTYGAEYPLGICGRKAYAKLIAGGCFVCSEPLDIDADYEDIMWLDKEKPLCGQCGQDIEGCSELEVPTTKNIMH